MEKIKINLSSDSIKDAISKLNEYKSSLNKRLDSAMEEIASSGAEKASSLWDSLPFTPTNEKPNFSYEKISNGYRITGEGKGVAFAEYGTGLNAELPHIGKTPEFINSGYHHWHMPLDVAYKYNNGKTYTEGNVAGHFMYDTAQWVRKNYKVVMKENIGDK